MSWANSSSSGTIGLCDLVMEGLLCSAQFVRKLVFRDKRFSGCSFSWGREQNHVACRFNPATSDESSADPAALEPCWAPALATALSSLTLSRWTWVWLCFVSFCFAQVVEVPTAFVCQKPSLFLVFPFLHVEPGEL